MGAGLWVLLEAGRSPSWPTMVGSSASVTLLVAFGGCSRPTLDQLPAVVTASQLPQQGQLLRVRQSGNTQISHARVGVCHRSSGATMGSHDRLKLCKKTVAALRQQWSALAHGPISRQLLRLPWMAQVYRPGCCRSVACVSGLHAMLHARGRDPGEYINRRV